MSTCANGPDKLAINRPAGIPLRLEFPGNFESKNLAESRLIKPLELTLLQASRGMLRGKRQPLLIQNGAYSDNRRG
jgi:hypothetical protein